VIPRGHRVPPRGFHFPRPPVVVPTAPGVTVVELGGCAPRPAPPLPSFPLAPAPTQAPASSIQPQPHQGKPMPRKRHDLVTADEWTDFLEAFDALHTLGGPFPRLTDFADAHATLFDGCGGRHPHHPHFLPWVRHLLHRFERALQETRRGAFVPYWSWEVDAAIPAALDQPELLERWRVVRQFRFHEMPPRELMDAVRAIKRFDVFQRMLEIAVHAEVVAAVAGADAHGRRGTFATAAATRDPLFWVHLANIDRMWVEFQARCPQEGPRTPREVLEPAPLFGVPVQAVLTVQTLGYAYA
jgi:hypothetical protein